MAIPSDRKEWIKILGVCLLSFSFSLIYHKHDFVYDDGVAVVQNTDVTNTSQTLLKSVYAPFLHDFWGQNLSNVHSHKSYRPLVTIVYHLQFRFFNHSYLPLQMKLVNLLLHFIICCLMFEVLRCAFKEIDMSIIANATQLFAAHPIHTEVIYSVVGSADLLCTFFFFKAFTIFLGVIREHEKTGEVNWIRTIILLNAAALCVFCKETGLMVLPLFAVYDIVTNASLPRIRRRELLGRRFEFLQRNCQKIITRCVHLTVMTIMITTLRLYMTSFTLPSFTADENPVAAHPSLFTRFFSSCYIHALSMWLHICPEWLCCDWSNGALKLIETYTDYRIILTLIFYGLLIYTFNVGTRSVRISIAFLVIPFIPSSHLVTVGFVLADRVLYIPSIGFCLLIAIGVNTIHLSYPKIVRTIFVVVLLVFMMRSNERSIDWQNNTVLFESATRVCPENAKMHFNMGQISAVGGDHKKSLKYNLIANKLQPNNARTLNNLGNAYRHLNQIQMAINVHKNVTDLEPGNAISWMNLGVSYVTNNSFIEALAAYQTADMLKPNDEKILFNLGNLYLRIGSLEMAEKLYRKSVKIAPKSQRAHTNLIVYLSEHGTQEELMYAVDKANLTMSNNVPVLFTIAKAFGRINFDFERVEHLYERIL